MKRIIFFVLLVAAFASISRGNPVVAQGNSNSEFGDYTITKLEDHLVIDGRELDKYLISYEKPEMKVIVAVDKLKNCKRYYVISGDVAVQYECNGVYFGINRVDSHLGKKGLATAMDKLNRGEFYHQKVLTRETRNTVDHLNLIASYFPGLLPASVS